MCGIVADLDMPAGRSALGQRMLDRLAHRGPDGSGSARAGAAWLGHRRLAIVDLEGGHQPLLTIAGNLHMVGNGEVYNHRALRRRLGARRFVTASDNEVALHLVDVGGPGALAEMDGMYAFVVAGDDGRFVAVRDPVGIKPLYWARRGRRTLFASELRAFEPEWRGEVEAFPPGHYWTPEGGLVRFATIDRRAGIGALGDERPAADADPDHPVLRAIRRALRTAVERRMMADVPVGVLLSGGLDSSLVAGIAAEHARRGGLRLKTFAVGTAGSPDLAAARTVAAFLDTEHHERVYTAEEAIATVPEVVRVLESAEPSLVRSAVPNALVAELAARHCKVVLTGEGADELFAGYDYLDAFTTADELHAELTRTVEGLHSLNLQRCDRVTMAHGLEARVPFLDLGVIALGLGLPAAWKQPSPGRMEKHLLRQAFAGALPDEVLWRRKAEFGDGSGASAVLRRHMEDRVTQADLERAQAVDDPAPRTREELAYQRLFRRHLDGVRPDRVLGRFATA